MSVKSEERIFILGKRDALNADVVRLEFAPESGTFSGFKAGQYITLYFLESSFGWQGKSYSIANAPEEAGSDDNYISIVVKKIGGFSSALHNLKIGDKVKIVGPTGYFYPSPEASKLVFLAAGIGISPFRSILKSLEKTGGIKNRDITLFYTNKTKDGIVFFDELNEVAKKNPGLKIIHFLTRSEGKSPGIQEFDRINGDALKKYASPLPEREYLICGSIEFVNDMWSALKEEKVPEEKIITEAFY